MRREFREARKGLGKEGEGEGKRGDGEGEEWRGGGGGGGRGGWRSPPKEAAERKIFNSCLPTYWYSSSLPKPCDMTFQCQYFMCPMPIFHFHVPFLLT